VEPYLTADGILHPVEMEERIAEQFNIAVRAYKARQAEK
jgi:hypothetical protein